MLYVKDPTAKAAIAFVTILVFLCFLAPFASDVIGAKASYCLVMVSLVAWLGYRFVSMIRDR